MKCIESRDGEVRRVTDNAAVELVKTGKWKYTDKTTWKWAVSESVVSWEERDGAVPKAK